MTKYTVLTGATGLLGANLLKDLLQADMPVVVLVRSSRMESAHQRIEGILRRSERLLGRPLPRPVIFESNLHQPDLGLNKEERQWLSRHADTMLHNAASLSFVANDRGEPYKSNVDGTRHVLELCRETGIRRFHHVSTAYVCGRRKGKILESELDDSQGFGNDYEKSKFTAETMVRKSEFLDSVTVFRPAIIVGDSLTGYTPTFHGFYAPIKILSPLIEPATVDVDSVEVFAHAIGMNPGDRKNFVPVDWISRVVSFIVLNKRLHDECYHLTAANRVPINEMSRQIAEGIIRFKKSDRQQSTAKPIDLKDLLPLFREQMTVYQAYWKDDPEFDMTNTRRAVPQYPPMTMTPALLDTLIRYAIESRFGWPKPKPTDLGFTTDEEFGHGTLAEPVEGGFQFGLRVTGSGGGDWALTEKDGEYHIAVGLNENGPLLSMNSETFRMIAENGNRKTIRSRSAWECGNSDEFDRALEAIRIAVRERRERTVL